MPKILCRISQATVILMILGWIAVVYTALFLKGGHPPLSAYVGMAVIMSSWILGTAGTLSGLASMRNVQATPGQLVFVILNAGLLGFSILINYM
jgi:hypothetical protein